MKHMMHLAAALTVLACVTACSSGRGSSSALTGEVTLGKVIVSWREANVLKEPNDGTMRAVISFSSVDHLQPGDPGYTGCWPAMKEYAACQKRHGGVVLTRDQTIRLADEALAAHPHCEWDGFDPVYDVRARGNGLASLSDTRMLFAKIRCTS